jgi:hypothetical protein
VVTETFRRAIWDFRRAGGKLYELAHRHDISPSLLSATLSGARRCDYDPRVIAIGETLGVQPGDVFVDEDAAVLR